MQNLTIEIKKARISSFSVQLEKEFPVVTATIELLTEGGRPITSYQIGSEHWQDHMKFSLPIEMIAPIKRIAAELEKIVTAHCQNTAKMLPSIPEAQEVPF